MCKYSDSSNYKCPHESLKDSEYCIFHLQDDKKNIDEFNKRIKEILETEKDLINFNGFYFPPNTDFFRTYFRRTVFFLNAIFSGDADFTHAKFSGDADFADAKFSENADFTHSDFSENADFTDAKFSGDANFAHSNFSKNADFVMATFSGDADFTDAKFSENADFTHSDFSGDADFADAKFSENAGFIGAKFSENAGFIGAKFSENAGFIGARFSGDVDFTMATFSENADFAHSNFSKNADFADAKFSGDADFADAKFSGDADFADAKLTGKFVFIPTKSETIIFNNTYFSDNIRIKTDMSKCSLVNSNIERVDITDSIWIVENKPKNSYSALIEWFKNKIGISETSIIIWEERQGKLSSNWIELEGIYRRLKQSYQKFGDNSTAGKFYHQEMECKRNQLRGFKKLFWNVFYKKLCGYGEKPFNVIWFSGLIILASSLFFFYCGIELLGSEVLNFPARLIDYKLSLNFQWVITNRYKVIGDWLVCLYTSVITFTTLGYGDVHPIGWSRIVASIEAGFGIIMTALFIFVFTRKMLR